MTSYDAKVAVIREIVATTTPIIPDGYTEIRQLSSGVSPKNWSRLDKKSKTINGVKFELQYFQFDDWGDQISLVRFPAPNYALVQVNLVTNETTVFFAETLDNLKNILT